MLCLRRILLTRDNSTGFTIQWGTGVNFSSSTIYITLPRTFTAFRSVVAVPGNTHGYGGIRANINSNSNIRMYSNSTGDGENTSWVALGSRDNSTGFTIVWGSASAGGGVWTTFARSFSSVLSVAFAPWDSGNYSWGNNLNNSGFSHHSSGSCKYIAVGFS